jgi:hypothetical protein
MMEDYIEEDLFNTIQRWEVLGLLDGLPIREKSELAQIYDNATRLLLSNRTLSKVPKNITDTMDDVFIPICRRLYKRVGPNFDLDEMLATLLESVNQNIDEIRKPITKENNPSLDFCIDFADTYEDRSTNKNTLTNEEYSNKIENMLSYLRQILLNDSMVSYVGKEDDVHRLNLVESKRTKEQTRFWNQSIAKNFLNSYLSEVNKGL